MANSLTLFSPSAVIALGSRNIFQIWERYFSYLALISLFEINLKKREYLISNETNHYTACKKNNINIPAKTNNFIIPAPSYALRAKPEYTNMINIISI